MSQMRMAIGIDTCAYSNRESAAGTAGRNRPTRIPATMQRITQTERFFSKNPIPESPVFLPLIATPFTRILTDFFAETFLAALENRRDKIPEKGKRLRDETVMNPFPLGPRDDDTRFREDCQMMGKRWLGEVKVFQNFADAPLAAGKYMHDSYARFVG
jgi:hypothetical protein